MGGKDARGDVPGVGAGRVVGLEVSAQRKRGVLHRSDDCASHHSSGNPNEKALRLDQGSLPSGSGVSQSQMNAWVQNPAPSATSTGGSRGVPSLPAVPIVRVSGGPSCSTGPPRTVSLNSHAPVPLWTSLHPGWPACVGIGGRHIGITGRHHRNTQRLATSSYEVHSRSARPRFPVEPGSRWHPAVRPPSAGQSRGIVPVSPRSPPTPQPRDRAR